MANTKFRAFHKPSKTMYWFDIMNGNTHGTGSGYISMAPFGEPITKFRHKDNLTPVDPEDCEMMQFSEKTGTDKQEIYDGDILKITYRNRIYKMPPGSSTAVEWTDFKEKLLEVFTEPGMWLTRFHNGQYHAHLVTACLDANESGGTIEVIGNIYQNPELLNSKEVTNG